MATRLWAKVYYQDTYAGLLEQEPGGRCVFTYDSSYLISPNPKIAFLLPLREEPFISENGLHPFFDNLVAEGWFQNAQARALQVNANNRFALLLGFGYDLMGAVSVIDPEPRKHITLDHADDVTIAALLGRASLSGIQPKLLVVKEGHTFRPVRENELSTHIAKLPMGSLQDIAEVEYLTTLAIKTLLPEDSIVELEIGSIASISEKALIIKRFDRTPNGKKIHFEEFNQLLGHASGDSKYDGSYEDMGRFINTTPGCIPVETYRIYKRILVCLLLGNTDAHFKNFAMFHTSDGLRLTPSYDLVSAARYKEYHSIALSIGGAQNLDIGALKAKHLVNMARAFKLNDKTICSVVEDLQQKLPSALAAIAESKIGTKHLQSKLIDMMEKRWKGSFVSIGQLLSQRQSKDGSSKN